MGAGYAMIPPDPSTLAPTFPVRVCRLHRAGSVFSSKAFLWAHLLWHRALPHHLHPDSPMLAARGSLVARLLSAFSLLLYVAAQLLAGIGVVGGIRQVVQRGAIAAGQVYGREQLTFNVRPLGGNAVSPHIVTATVTTDQVEPYSCHTTFLSRFV